MADDATGVTAEELAAWLTPRQALTIVNEAFGDIKITAHTILERLKGGLIKAGAKSSSWGESGFPTAQVLISARSWSHVASGSEWWNTGDIRFFFPRDEYNTQNRTGRYFGIKFEPSSVRVIVADRPKRPAVKPTPAVIPAQAPQPTKEVNRGGRPPKGWWDDLWVEIARQLYGGALIPKRQADIEKAMADWVFALGEEASERTFREAARKLWRAINNEGKN